jgi:hypothetical protein
VSFAINLGEDQPTELPVCIELAQNYPNSFNSKTTISFTLPERGLVEVLVHSVTVLRETDVANFVLSSDMQQVVFDASRLASGTYIYRVRFGG